MYSVSENYTNKIISNDRTFAIRLTFGSSTEITGTSVQNITFDEIINSANTLTMGCACSNKVTINLINPPTNISYNNAEFFAEVGLLTESIPATYEWLPLGRFFGTIAETSNDFKNLKLTAYDGFVKMSGKYNATVTEETTLQDVYDDLRAQLLSNCGVTLVPRTLPAYTLKFPYLDITYTQAVAYVAGCLGEVARFNRNGELEMTWYTDANFTIGRSLQYMNGFKRTTDRPLIITSLKTGTQENPIVRGEGANGTAITFENPYITDTMADDIYAKVNGLTYTPSKVKWRGNPAVQCGDIVQVLDNDSVPNTVLIMSQSVSIGGGCNATIECNGNSETTSEFTSKFESVGQKIDRVYSTLEKAILDATNAITGNSGGYVTIHDTNGDGKPDEILVTDVENYETATSVWRWNKEGFGHAKTYAGPYSLAFTADGAINASLIITGRLNAEMVSIGDENSDYIRLNDGVMYFGSKDDELSLRLGTITVDGETKKQLAFYSGETRIAYFSSNSFEIENLTDGRIRFQNFGFIPRASGNLSFTLLT